MGTPAEASCAIVKDCLAIHPTLDGQSPSPTQILDAIWALSYASAFGLRNGPTQDQFVASTGGGQLNWQKYLVVYHDPAAHRLLWKELTVPPANPAYVTTPLEEVDFGSGRQPLATYLTGGEALLARV